MTGQQAMSKIFMFLLDVAAQNLEGMKQDIDTEFLHDFRVSVRRTRAALSQIKGVFSDVKINKYKQMFSDIGKSTNRLRDLDVYLLNKDYYYTLVPDIFKQGLDFLFIKLAKQRAYEHKKLVALIESGRFKDALDKWRSFLSSDLKTTAGPNANAPVLKLAQNFIHKQFTKVISQGKKIDKKTSDKKIHDLRIECKKLRYLMEFFASLFPEEDINYLIKQLKMLQDNLGDFNDLAVQQLEMQDYLQEVDWNLKSAQTITAALGGLIASLNNKQKDVRGQFFTKFATFSSIENEVLFAKLFNPENSKQEQA
jgi:CHAD domain-containing protein